MSLEDDVRREGEAADLRAALARAQRAYAKLKAEREDYAQAVYRAAHDAALAHGAPAPVPRPKRGKRRAHPMAGLLHFSDWQLGKVTPTYSSEVCADRIARCVEKVVEITDDERARRPVDDVHVIGGGDMVEGVDIFPGQVHEIDASLYDQVFHAADVLASSLLTLLREFRVVHFYEVAGNHGRIGRRGVHPRRDNADRIMYEVARRMLTHEKRLVWHPQDRFYQLLEVGAYRALAVHGDQIRGGGGGLFPWYATQKRFDSWKVIIPGWVDAYFGHRHVPVVVPLSDGTRAFMCPSPESSNQYAEEGLGSSGRPAQRFHLIDPRRGWVAADRLVWLDD